MTFISTANSALIAIMAGLLISLFGTGVAGAAAVGAVLGLAFFTGSSVYGYRTYMAVWRQFTPVSPTPRESP